MQPWTETLLKHLISGSVHAGKGLVSGLGGGVIQWAKQGKSVGQAGLVSGPGWIS